MHYSRRSPRRSSYHRMKVLTSFAFLLAGASAQSIIESSSFGHGRGISPSRDHIPGWQLGGVNYVPQILSDKIILTPPYPGDTRGFAWSQSPLAQSEWTAELLFRATGPERGGGNLQLWYAKDGQTQVGASSIYTVRQFDGFVLAIDSHGEGGGSVRGFLNDGTTDYNSHRSVDSLAFGHCEYAYRNLGRPSSVRVKYTNSILEVTVDDRPCFQTDKVVLYPGNTFGLTGATPENPDTFEIFRFVVQSDETGGASIPVQQQQEQQQIYQQEQPMMNQAPNDEQPMFQGFRRPSVNEQFIDLANRLQGINKAVGNTLREVTALSSKSDASSSAILQKMATAEQVASLDARLLRVEQTLAAMQQDLQSKDYHGRFNQLQETLRTSHLHLREGLQDSLFKVITASTPRMGFFIFLVISVQLFLAGSYIFYKRRRANMPKKFL